MAATVATVTRLTARTQYVGHKLYMDNSPPDLFDDLCTETINKQTVISMVRMENF